MKIFVGIAWPYVNGDLHLGHVAGAMLPADIFARYHRHRGHDVLMVSGSDVHGTPSIIRAELENTTPAKVAEKYHLRHLKTIEDLGLEFSLYTKTDTKNHKDIVQQLFLDLYKKKFLIKKTTKQYWYEKEKKFLLDRFIEGECPHCHFEGARGDQCEKCGRTLEPTELINPRTRGGDTALKLEETEDFFLDLTALSPDIMTWLKDHSNIENWREAVVSFTNAWIQEGLEPRAITRNLSYGIPLPDEVKIKDKADKVIYVWFEAVTGYLSAAVEWSKRISGENDSENDVIFHKIAGQAKSWRDFWMNPKCRHYYFLGKDNIVFHTIIWPAMLLGWNHDRDQKEQLNLAYDVPANAWLTLEGKKMSKSRNWFVDLRYLIDEYGSDLVRYYLTLRMPETKDSNFKWQDFIDVNNNDLVANLGNFIHRTLTFIESRYSGIVAEGELENEVRFEIRSAFKDTEDLYAKVKLSEALMRIQKLVAFGNRYFDKQAVWKVVKEDKKAAGKILFNCVQIIDALKVLLHPVIPHAAERLARMLGQKEHRCSVGKDLWRVPPIRAKAVLENVEPLFAKLDDDVVQKELAKLGTK